MGALNSQENSCSVYYSVLPRVNRLLKPQAIIHVFDLQRCVFTQYDFSAPKDMICGDSNIQNLQDT